LGGDTGAEDCAAAGATVSINTARGIGYRFMIRATFSNPRLPK
jgi:hypothetical protein